MTYDGYAHIGDTIQIKAFWFGTDGELITGLSPAVDIIGDLSGSLLVNDGAMTESVSMLGIYYYDYQTAEAGILTYKAVSTAGEAVGSWLIGTGELPDVTVTGYVAPDNSGILSIKTKTDNLPSDPASNTIVLTRLNSSDYIAPDNTGIAAIIASLDTGFNVDESSFHSALNTWSPPTGGYVPPIIVPPENSDDCRVYIWMGWLSASEYPETIRAFAQVTSAPYISDGRAFSGKVTGTFDSQNGIVYWDVVRGADVQIKIIEYNINIKVTVPDSAVYDLSESLDS